MCRMLIKFSDFSEPDAPPAAVYVSPSSSGMKIKWDEPIIISGPTSYLIDIVSVSQTNELD